MSFPPGMSPEMISVLVADSNQTQSQLLGSALRRQGMFQVTRCRADLSECLSVVEADAADVGTVAGEAVDDGTITAPAHSRLRAEFAPNAAVHPVADQDLARRRFLLQFGSNVHGRAGNVEA